MLDSSDTEHDARNDSEIEITDLDVRSKNEKLQGKQARWRYLPAQQRSLLLSITVIVGVVLLVALIRFPPASKVAKPIASNMQVNYPVSVSVIDGVSYVGLTDGTVKALRTSDGFPLWTYHNKSGEESVTVDNGVVYLVPYIFDNSTATVSIVTVTALHAQNGSPLWTRTFTSDSPATLQLIVANGIVYLRSDFSRIDALRASDGTLLWHYTAHTPLVSMSAATKGVVCVSTQDGVISILRANDGLLLWKYLSADLTTPIVVDDAVYLNLHERGIEALRVSDGKLLWHYTSPAPATYLPLLINNGVVYVGTQEGAISALRVTDGSLLWRIVLHVRNQLSFLIVQDGVIYTNEDDGIVYALHNKDGSEIWHYQGQASEQLLMVAQGVVYLGSYAGTGIASIARVIALRASDSSVLWRYVLPTSATQVLPTDDLVLIALQDGHVNAVSASTGALRWQRAVAG